MTTGTLTTHMPPDQITVRDTFNVRRDIADVDELAESISLLGMLVPLIVDTDGNLIAGHRRLQAARKLGLDTVPVHVTEASSEPGRGQVAAAAAENIARQQLSPAEEADAIDRMLAAGYTADGAAKALGMTLARVTRRLVLLKIPADLRALWGPPAPARLEAAGAVATLLEKAPQLAPLILHAHNATAGTNRDDRLTVDDLAEDPVWYVTALRRAAHAAPGSWNAIDGMPKWPADTTLVKDRIEAGDPALKLPKPVRQSVNDVANKGRRHGLWNLSLRLEPEDLDAARAAGVTVELTDRDGDRSELVTDVHWLTERIKSDILPRLEQKVQAAARKSRNRSTATVTDRKLTAAEKRAKETETRQREAEKRWKELAPGANLDLGRELLHHLAAVKLTPDIARFFAEASLGPRRTGAANPYAEPPPLARLAAAGMRHIMPGWQTATPAPTKADPGRTVSGYLSIEEAEDKVWNWFDGARTAEEILGRALVIHAAARWTVENSLPRGQRIMPDHHRSTTGRFTVASAAARKSLERIGAPILPASLKSLIAEIETFDPAKPNPASGRTV